MTARTMPDSGSVISVLVLCVLAAWGVLAVRPDGDPPSPQPSRSAALEPDMRETRPNVTHVARTHAPARRSTPAPTSARKPVPAPVIQMTSAQPRIDYVSEAQPAHAGAQLAPARSPADAPSASELPAPELQARWSDEPADPAWSAEVTEYLRETSTRPDSTRPSCRAPTA